MGCLLIILSLITPRVVIFLLFLFTNWITIAFNTILWPILGFIFMPYTTLAYMTAMVYNNHNVAGGWLVLVVVAAIIDLGGQGAILKR